MASLYHRVYWEGDYSLRTDWPFACKLFPGSKELAERRDITGPP